MEEKKKPNFLQKLATSYRKIPDKKPYIEFVTAMLSIPVLLTVILLNLNTLTGTKDQEAKGASITPQTIVVTAPNESNQQQVVTQQKECTPEIGPVEIVSPEEDEEISDNPLSVTINYDQGNYCSVVWAYRINGGAWSDYDDKSIALYNPPSGTINFELKVKSVVGADSTTLTRTFIYKGTEIIQTTPTASSSAN